MLSAPQYSVTIIVQGIKRQDRTMEKMSLFEGTVDGLDPGSEEGSSSAFCNLDDALNTESERKPATWREDQREGKLEHSDTGTAASPTKKETVTSAEEILKNKGDRTKFQNDATFSKFSSGNQSDEEDENISKSWRNVLHFTSQTKIVISYYY